MTAATDDQARTYPEGVTSWVDVEQRDVEASLAFYGGLFGWTFADAIPRGAPVRYVIAQLDGQDVGAIAGPSDASGDVSGSPGWQTYVAVADAEAAATRVKAAGGQVIQPPTTPGDGGTSVVCADPDGVEFRLWQADQRLGSQLTNVPGSWNFSNLHTNRPEVARTFYAEVFPWEVDDFGWAAWIRVPGYGDHLASTIDPDIHERQSGSAVPPGFADVIGSVVPLGDGEEPHWDVVFTVTDRDATAARAEVLNGTVLRSADEDWTKTAVIRDPQGAVFTASQFTPPQD